MKINELMAMQKELDDYIIKTKGLENKSERDLLNATYCAAYSELLEVNEANEEMLGEELIDVLHFVLAIGYRLKLEGTMQIPMEDIECRGDEDTNILFIKLTRLMDHSKSYKFWSNKEPASIYVLSRAYYSLFRELWGLLKQVIGNNENIISEYQKKYETNIQRQRSGY